MNSQAIGVVTALLAGLAMGVGYAAERAVEDAALDVNNAISRRSIR